MVGGSEGGRGTLSSSGSDGTEEREEREDSDEVLLDRARFNGIVILKDRWAWLWVSVLRVMGGLVVILWPPVRVTSGRFLEVFIRGLIPLALVDDNGARRDLGLARLVSFVASDSLLLSSDSEDVSRSSFDFASLRRAAARLGRCNRNRTCQSYECRAS